MKTYSSEQLSEMLSLYLDGRLSGEELAECEEYLAAHPEARRELDELRRMKHLLAARPGVSPDPYFWTRFEATLESSKEEDENLLPFPRKYVPLASALSIMAFVAIGVTLFLQRGPLMQYLSERSQEVKKAYEANILKGSVMPLFNNIDNDKVLQFALFGTLPLDAKAETALRVDENSKKGYRIEVGMTAKKKTPPVTVHELYSAVRPTRAQEQLIDSVLQEARARIEKGAFYAENNALAIDPALTKLNRAVLSNIAAVLAPVQRVRFDRFLNKQNASFAVAANEVQAPAEAELEMREMQRSHRSNRYIVVTPDSLMVTPLELNIDSLVRMAPPWVDAPMAPELSMRLERLMRSHFERRVVQTSQSQDAKLPIRMENEENFFKIEFGAQLVPTGTGSVRVWVTPRPRREQTFRFESRSSAGVNVVSPPNVPQVHVEVDFGEIDSMMKMIQQQRVRNERQFKQLDSILRARASKRMNAPRPVPDSVQKR